MLVYTKVQNIWIFIPLVPSKREKKLLVLLSLFLREVCLLHNCEFYHSKNLKVNTLPSQNIQIEQTYYIHFSLISRKREEETKTNISHHRNPSQTLI